MDRKHLLISFLLHAAIASATHTPSELRTPAPLLVRDHGLSAVSAQSIYAVRTADADVLRINYNKPAPKPPVAPKTSTVRPPHRSALLARAGTRLEPR